MTLPDGLGVLVLGNNPLGGILSMTNLPACLEHLHLADNSFDQEVLVVGELPPELYKIEVTENNRFSRIRDSDGNLLQNEKIR